MLCNFIILYIDKSFKTAHNTIPNSREKRADAVTVYLKEQGIGDERVEWAGYGAERPVADNSTEEGRRLNRRTTIKILDK